MRVHTGDNKLVTITEPKTIHFDLFKDPNNNLKHKIDFITKHYELLPGQAIKMRFVNYYANISMEIVNKWSAQICSQLVAEIRFKKFE